jgi:iron complex transport system permease protein
MAERRAYGRMAAILYFLVPLSTLLVLAVVSLGTGAYRHLGIRKSILLLIHAYKPTGVEQAIFKLRLARTLAGVIVGSALALSGSGLQYALRNPLADPYILGMASGAALGVILAIYTSHPDPLTLYSASIAGSLVSLAGVLLGGILGGGSPFAYVIAGIGVGYLSWALSIILIVMLGPRAHYGIAWLFGTLAYVGEEELGISGLLTLSVLVITLLLRRRYEKLLLGEEVSSVYGVPYREAAFELVLLSGLLTASATALAGPVGFVGLVAPWVARLTVGVVYGRFIVSSVLWGSSLVIASDIASRILGGSYELPLTAVMSFVGVPFLLYASLKARGGSSWS